MTTDKRPLGAGDFQPGDQVKINGTWLRVVRANPKTITVRNPKGWNDRWPYADVEDRNPKHVQLPASAPTTLPPRTEVIFGWYGGGLSAEVFRHGADAVVSIRGNGRRPITTNLGPVDDFTAEQAFDEHIEAWFEALEAKLGL